MSKILVINPGSTSTKIAVFRMNEKLHEFVIQHSVVELSQFLHISEQFQYRYDLIIKSLEENEIPLDFSIVMGRGGMLPPVESGVFQINQKMLDTLERAERGEHASNLGAALAFKIANECDNCSAYIADPVSVDEFQSVSRISGMPEIPRQSIFHALNQKAAGRWHAMRMGTEYDKLNLVIAHMGGGISIAAHKKGRVIDVNQGLDGYGAFSPERSGTVDAGRLVRMCYSGNYSEREMLRKLAGKGGLTAHFGINDVRELEQKANEGDERVKLILEAMSYSIGKEIGGMLAALRGNVDAVILTGGVAHSQFVTSYIKQMIEPFAPMYIYPGEDEMAALASNAVRVLNGEKAKEF